MNWDKEDSEAGIAQFLRATKRTIRKLADVSERVFKYELVIVFFISGNLMGKKDNWSDFTIADHRWFYLENSEALLILHNVIRLQVTSCKIQDFKSNDSSALHPLFNCPI